MHKFLIVIEKANGNYSAYSPDLPGCVATGTSRVETENGMYEAIEMHIQGRKEDGEVIPESYSYAEYVVLARANEKKHKRVTRSRRDILKRIRKNQRQRLTKS